jgi:hypothetical protein
MLELKPLSREAIPAALAKAERYRLLNEPEEAESICMDVLRCESNHEQATIMLLLALTDQFAQKGTACVARAQTLADGLPSEYERAYYRGIVAERHAKAALTRGAPGGREIAYEQLRAAMTCYEHAETLRLRGNDDAILRWNACARVLIDNPELRPQSGQWVEQPLE